MTYRYSREFTSPMIVWNLADHTEFSPPLVSSLPPSHPFTSQPLEFISCQLNWSYSVPFEEKESINVSSTREFIIGCGLATFQKRRSGHYSLKTIVITWPGRRMSLACISNTAFKGKGESIMAKGDKTPYLKADRFECLYQIRILCWQREH